MQTALTGQATPEQIQKWKDDHGKIVSIYGGGHIAYFREPNLSDLNFAASQVDSDTPLDFNKVVMTETKVGGSAEILDNQKLFMGASKQMNKLIEGEKMKLSEL